MAGTDGTTTSYNANNGELVGMPLSKGERHGQKSLVFDDPGMRPKVFVKDQPINHPQFSLISNDIWGAQSKPKNTPARPRNTDPNVPRYNLPGATSSLPPQTATTHRVVRDHVREVMFPGDGVGATTTTPPADPAPMRSLTTADINTASRTLPPWASSPPGCVERPVGSLAVADIPGSVAGWKPPHRVHVGVGVPPDKLSCADINGYMLPKSYKTLFKGEQAAAAAGGQGQAQRVAQRQRPATAGATRRTDTAAAPDLPTGFEYTGLPAFQGPPPSAEAWDAARTARAGEGPAEKEAAAVSRAVQEQLVNAQAQLDHATWLQHVHNDVAIGHRTRVAQADAKCVAKAAANAAVAAMVVPREGVGALWRAMQDLDRTRSGRLTASELSQAFERAGVARSTAQMADLARGLADHAGLLPYRDLARVLLIKAQVPGSSPALFANIRPAAAATQRQRPASAHPAGRSMPIGGGAAAPVPAAARVPLPWPPRHESSSGGAQPSPASATTAADAVQPVHAVQPGGATKTATLAHAAAVGRSMSIGGGAAAPGSTRVPLPWPPRQEGTQPTPAAVPTPEAVPTPATPVDATPVFADAGAAPAAQPAGTPYESAAPVGEFEPAASSSSEPHTCDGDGGFPVYNPHKGTPYWFGGANDPAEIEQQASEWTPVKEAVAGTSPHVGDAIAAARSPPAYLAPTASSRLKAGELVGGARPGSAQGSRPGSAQRSRAPSGTQQGGVVAWHQQALLAAALSGTSAGGLLHGTISPVGTGALGLGAPHTREESTCPRAMSARPAAGACSPRPVSAHVRRAHTASFSSVAHTQGGHAMARLHDAMLRSDVQAVRRLI
ncbi:hypothetical protein FOA52_014851 [Chlamydomonas sp. UWO 241]|nr:hypothetical protein FOA52_014851 [Chlamydomonas sp. UWO 241]